MINKNRLIRLTQKVVSINSENPPGNEVAVAQFVKKDLQQAGLSVKTVTYAKNRPNIIAVLKGSRSRAWAAREALLLTPHLDTVPVGRGWMRNPWGKEIQGGKLYGRGTSDDKGNLACCMEVARSLSEDGVALKRDIIVAATADEETGSNLGIISLLERKVLRPKAALILDSDEFDTIVTQKGLVHFKVKIFGKKAHGAYNWRGRNAIEDASAAIALLKKISWKYQKHHLLRGPTLNIGTISGGEKVNIVADYCEFSVDIRFVPGMNPKAILAQVRGILKKCCARYTIEVSDIQNPYEISAQHPFVSTYLTSARKLGVTPTVKGCEGATVITFFKKYRIPAFATGFGSKGTAHISDEYARISTLVKGARVLEQFVKDYDARN